MITARRLPNGNLLIPQRAEGPGGIVGDGAVEIGPGHPDYASWLADMEKFGPKPQPADDLTGGLIDAMIANPDDKDQIADWAGDPANLEALADGPPPA